MRNSAEKKIRIINAIIAARRKAGLNQVEASLLMGRPKNYMTKIESAKREVKAWELYEIAQTFGIDARELLPSPRGRRPRQPQPSPRTRPPKDI